MDLNLRNFADAQDVLEKATQIDPTHARAQAALGMALSDQGKYDEAIPKLEKSLEINAGNPNWETQYALAQAYYKSEKYPEAVKMSQAALEKSNGKAPEIALLEAQALVTTQKYDEAAQVLRVRSRFCVLISCVRLNFSAAPQPRNWIDRTLMFQRTG